MDMKPREESIDINGIIFKAMGNNGNTVTFDSFYGLCSFILGEPDDNIDPHIGMDFGAYELGFVYSATNKNEAEAALKNLEAKCKQIEWEELPYHDDDNTIYYPKRKWLEQEYENIVNDIDKLQRKKQKLDQLLGMCDKSIVWTFMHIDWEDMIMPMLNVLANF